METLSAQQLNPNYGNGRHQIDRGDEVLAARFDLDERLAETFRSTSYRPPVLPAVALEMLQLANSPTVSVNDVVGRLELDPVLASGILKLVRSPLHAGRARVRSLKEAVVRLGLQRIRDVALEVAMSSRVFRAAEYSNIMGDLAVHSRATAHVARIVCRYATWDADHAFLCGLMHDIGMVASLLVLADVPRGQARPDASLIIPAIQESHPERGQMVARLWGMPEEVVTVIGHHHHVSIDGHTHPLAAIVCIAEYVATRLGRGPLQSNRALLEGQPDHAPGTGFDETPVRQMTMACDALSLSPRQIERIAEDATALLAKTN